MTFEFVTELIIGIFAVGSLAAVAVILKILVQFIMELRETYQSQELRLIEQHNKQKERMIYSVLGIEANKHHANPVDPNTLPQVTTEFREELIKKYSDVSNKYNEILEVTTASHQGIGNLMAEFSDFKESIAYRMNRLEEYNLTSGQVEEYRKKVTE